ncbi:MAG: NYN domain-containing protein [Coriobacteriia bacterium]|nr:NYN domain-containing protein [Coriobacteriia bacterium]
MKYLLIDGYNLLFQADPYAALAQADEWDLARDALISDVASYAGQHYQATIVFDGKNNPDSDRKETNTLGVKVIFSDYGSSADATIERLAKQAIAAGKQLEIVSSDALIQWTTLGKGVVRRSAAEFVQQLTFAYGETERERDSTAKRSTISDRITPEAVQLLRQIRDGQSAPDARSPH